MKHLMAGLFAVAVLVPAAEVSQKELERGRDELLATTVASVEVASTKNKKHTWIKTAGYNFSQKYALQKELQGKGYDFDFPLFGSTYVGW